MPDGLDTSRFGYKVYLECVTRSATYSWPFNPEKKYTYSPSVPEFWGFLAEDNYAYYVFRNTERKSGSKLDNNKNPSVDRHGSGMITYYVRLV